jgi:uncharacterized membrane protein YdbT with pleckstrin-like domain
MSNILYESSPSMMRMHPLGTVLAVFVVLFGLALAIARGPLIEASGIPAEYDHIAGMAGMVLVGLGIVRLAIWWIATKLDRLVIKADEIVWTHGLITKQYTEINMGSVRTVRVSQSILQRVVNAGDVTIFTSGDLPELAVKGLPSPGAIRGLIKPDAE